MKTHYTLLLFSALFLVACNDDNNDNPPANECEGLIENAGESLSAFLDK